MGSIKILIFWWIIPRRGAEPFHISHDKGGHSVDQCNVHITICSLFLGQWKLKRMAGKDEKTFGCILILVVVQ
jgi:hypothetical protein